MASLTNDWYISSKCNTHYAFSANILLMSNILKVYQVWNLFFTFEYNGMNIKIIVLKIDIFALDMLAIVFIIRCCVPYEKLSNYDTCAPDTYFCAGQMDLYHFLTAPTTVAHRSIKMEVGTANSTNAQQNNFDIVIFREAFSSAAIFYAFKWEFFLNCWKYILK